jgi:hypothetical protein
MKGEAIPDSDHVARYCGGRTVDDGEIQATAFMLREGEEYLSVNWLEALSRSDRTSEIRELQDLYARKLHVGVAARIAILNVGAVRAKVVRESQDMRLLRVLHEPIIPDDPSHAGIYDIPHDDDLVAELIAQAVLENHPARA